MRKVADGATGATGVACTTGATGVTGATGAVGVACAETWVAATGTCRVAGSATFFGSGGLPPLGALSNVGITFPLLAALELLAALPFGV